MSLNYLKNIFKVLKWPILYGVGQFVIIVIFTLLFNIGLQMTSEQLSLYMKTAEYQNHLAQFLADNQFFIVFIPAIIFLPIFVMIYNKHKVNTKIKLNAKNYLLFSILGLSICFIFNIIVKNINDIVYFTDVFSKSIIHLNIFINILCVGIIGPIMEEYLFRGIIYNKIKTFNTNKNAVILTSLLFAFMHNNYVHIIYAFLLSLLLIYVYEKYKTLKAPIMIHLVANTCNIIFLDLIIGNMLIINILLLIVMSIILGLGLKQIQKCNYNN